MHDKRPNDTHKLLKHNIYNMKTQKSKLTVVVALTLLICLFSFCSKANEETAKAESVELLKTSQSWDGADLPDYLEGKPELRVLKVVIPPHSALPKHHHDVMSYGVVNKGALTLVRESDGKEKTVKQGEAVVETVGTVHHGENRGDEAVEVVVFYLSKEGMPLSVADE